MLMLIELSEQTFEDALNHVISGMFASTLLTIHKTFF